MPPKDPRLESLFFFFLQTLIDVIMHDQGIENHDIIID